MDMTARRLGFYLASAQVCHEDANGHEADRQPQSSNEDLPVFWRGRIEAAEEHSTVSL